MFIFRFGPSGFKRPNKESDDCDEEAELLLAKRERFREQLATQKAKYILSTAAGVIFGISSVIIYLLCVASFSRLFGKNVALKQTSYWCGYIYASGNLQSNISANYAWV